MNAAGLAAQQQALVQALLLPRHADAMKTIAAYARPTGVEGQKHIERGLQAYRSNGHALAQRALAAAYPVVAALMGAESFDGLSRHFWQHAPPTRGDVSQWGEAFADFIESLGELARDEPYLGEVARLEWALHGVATDTDGEADLGSLGLLQAVSPAQLTLRLCPGARTLPSSFPVVSIVLAHTGETPSLQEAGERLRNGVAETALVWRQGFRPALRQALPGEAAFIAALQHGHALDGALSAADGFDFTDWLAPAVHAGLLLGARAL
jgi:hypothetical protein